MEDKEHGEHKKITIKDVIDLKTDIKKYEEITYHCKKSTNILHRIIGPTYIAYEDKKCIMKRYYKNGKLHRTNGPAEIHYHNNGKINIEHYFIKW
jgi:antitoxin component YwqK of YwqJK toxin-antitoxin module